MQLNRRQQRKRRQEDRAKAAFLGFGEASLKRDAPDATPTHKRNLEQLCFLCFLLFPSASFRLSEGSGEDLGGTFSPLKARVRRRLRRPVCLSQRFRLAPVFRNFPGNFVEPILICGKAAGVDPRFLS